MIECPHKGTTIAVCRLIIGRDALRISGTNEQVGVAHWFAGGEFSV